ncbi:DNA methyltransferase [Caldifermentibacillus hisashii]|uniref:DNA methyltransferase n=1 Tax=Caldifermentibacillus hisashii TaxID=996558 RepID=UPI002E1F46BD|nr:DNA methyltransferase [Caldifermentibacillus hisashii]MED3643832.1 DNA methyltransferase [Caldifermentibacillus hisashii]
MDETKQMSLNIDQPETDNGPVVCLGMTFKNDDERREYFRNELRKKLPELKKIEGFPIGDDEDIIALSDPPYYTACPNPWINDFIEEWEREKDYSKFDEYTKVPYSNDVKEGKNDPIYNAHSYHTKVPYKAIIRYLLHYTKPGDLVFDGFAGSGMTGVAGQLCADRQTVEEMGYIVDEKGSIFIKKEDQQLVKISELGKRRVILTELSPAAGFMSYIYNRATDNHKLREKIKETLSNFEDKFSFLYLTLHNADSNQEIELARKISETKSIDEIRALFNKNKYNFGRINYIVWSDLYVCSNCSEKINYYESTVIDGKKVRKSMVCPECNAELDKNKLEKVMETTFDSKLKKSIEIAKQVPVIINYSVNKKRYVKKLDKVDIALIDKIEEISIPYWYPMDKLPSGYNLDQPQRSHNIQYVFQFYTKRNLLVISAFLSSLNEMDYHYKQFVLGSVLPKLTKMNRYMPQHGSRALVGPMANVLYFPPLFVENNVLDQLEFQTKKINKALNKYDGTVISTQSSTSLQIKSNSIDYIFIDPPFGANIMYSDLNFSREAWLKIKTDNKDEVIENSHQNKGLEEYKKLMVECLKEAYRILKPGRWITVEFSNTKASVWNTIQKAIQESGFVIASVDALDKSRGGLYSMITTTGVKQDLIISAYKPAQNISENNTYKTDISDIHRFVEEHLQHLPIFKGSNNNSTFISERDPRIIYDRMIAHFVNRNSNIPLSSPEFQQYLSQHFSFRDGMVFLENQVHEYDRKRLKVKEFMQLNLFITDEFSAIEWLRQHLMKKPQTRQDLHPEFMKQIQHIAKHEELPELDDLLEQNFLRFDGEEPVPNQILIYLRRNYKDLRGLEPTDPKVIEKAMHRWYVPDPNKQADLEKLREKSLLREFDDYLKELEGNKKKLRTFRTEAIRAGFKNAYKEKDFETIVKVGDRIPEKVIQEDDKLFMYYENAKIRLGL